MATTKVSVDKMADAVLEALQEYVDEAEDDLKDVVGKVAKEGRKKLKATSPRGTGTWRGHYADHWSTTYEREGNGKFKYTIHNRRKYQLAHLLEFGHANRDGGRTPAIEHIKPVEEWCVEECEDRIKKELGG